MLGNFSCVLSFADFFQNHLFGKKNSGIPLVSNSSGPTKSDLGPNCLQRLSDSRPHQYGESQVGGKLIFKVLYAISAFKFTWCQG